MANILLGVSAGIACYKAVDLASKLTQRGDRVRTLLTPNATRFIAPLTFRAVTGETAISELFGADPESSMEHITLAGWGDAFIIAPASADLIGRLAAGFADDLITTTALAFRRPIVLAPAMNDQMWSNPIVQANLERLAHLAGYTIIDPASGHLACGTVGPGRLPETSELIARLIEVLEASGIAAGRDGAGRDALKSQP
jgi:phosphopantothenoylcysteine decarboxylase/phosphopantothenate--cysteine ligase